MAYEMKDMTGSLFKNKRKESDNHPDYTGSVLINGVEMWISAWLKQGNSEKYMSLAFKPKDAKPAKPVPRGPLPADHDDSDLPF